MTALKFAPETIETIAVSELKPYERNPRTHSEDQVGKIAASMMEFGWTVPIMIDDENEIIAGHGRVMAARRLGVQSVPAIRLRHLSPEQVAALRIADNQITILGDWDMPLLSAETQNLGSLGFDLDILGFDNALLSRLLTTNGDGLTDPDDVPEVSKNVVSQTGYLWLLDKHRLLCGDCTDRSVVNLLCNGSADTILTDPPYSSGGFQDGQKRHTSSIGTRANADIARDNLSSRGYLELLRAMLSRVNAECAYVFTDWRMWSWTYDVMEASGYPVRNMLVWDKERMGMGFPWRAQHELICFCKRTGAEMLSGKNGNVLKARRTGNKNHPTEKPVSIISEIMENTVGNSFYDPFVGSGTTIIAAQITGRACFACEIAPQYVDVAVRRWQDFTGLAATLDGDGRTFDEIAEARQ